MENLENTSQATDGGTTNQNLQNQNQPLPNNKKSDLKIYLIIGLILILVFSVLVLGMFILVKYSNTLKEIFNENSTLNNQMQNKQIPKLPKTLETKETVPNLKLSETEPGENPTTNTTQPTAPLNQNQVQNPTPTPKPVCENRYIIREGEFKSDKCYSDEDYNDLVYYIRQYDMAVFDYNGAKNQADVTCQGFTDDFKRYCEEAKDEMDDAEDKMEEYEKIIKEILNKGTSYSKFQ